MRQLTDIVDLISKVNNQAHHHCGYAGTETEEIHGTLLTDFSDLPLEESLVFSCENGKVKGVLGLAYDQKTHTGELWGPFISDNGNLESALSLWKQLLNQLSNVPEKVYGFYNVHNELGQSFMESLGAKRKKDQSILAIHKDAFQIKTNSDLSIKEVTESDHELFKVLHDEAFPETYYDAKMIIDKLDGENKLFIAHKDDNFLGYAYCEANPEYGEGDLHYLAVIPEARNHGTGSSLIQKSLEFMFSFHEIHEITLCVEAGNQGAVRAYKRAGFIEKHILAFYEVAVMR
ncbi:GNAT family N-acetyltransferase [Mesobacillus subterraneus]|uniref:GNAT family N-acetyltransferase n=1 Tax=Mesobacillus subterraneus TaxID=285983 RepID=A0A427TWR3_9BACI|nr:GNAT family N-acetyltransferase [Mesobacillus subterraneus]RSD28844.1 GNAT family N-acetyltransferase [Mesobacillus subterraneus]